MDFRLLRKTKSWSILGCLLQPRLLLDQPLKSMRVNLFQLIKSCATRTVPATETKSIGLQADARVVMPARPNNLSLGQDSDRSFGRGFCTPPRQLYRDVTNPAYLSGPFHMDSFIVTPNPRPSTGTLPARLTPVGRAKTHANPDTDGNSLNRRAVSI
jgi:hypothetical protein